jgi:hypothetical protein
MRRLLPGTGLLGLLGLLPAIALAHHSTANFDHSQQQTVTGKVAYFGFTNPHSFIDLEVGNARSGKAEPYKVFTAGRVLLVRYDWKIGDLKAGDTVSITGYPDRKDPHFMYLSKVTFASGKVWQRDKIPD